MPSKGKRSAQKPWGVAGPRRRERRARVADPVPATGISRREWIALAAWTLLLLAAIAVPYVHGFRLAPPGWRFTGFVGAYHNDYNSYLAWMRQATDGHVLFEDLYTTEPHGRVFFHPLFWAMGTLARLTGATILSVWYAVQALSCAALVASIYRLAAHVTGEVPARVLGLVLCTTAAGLGWLTSSEGRPWVERSIDLWLAEANAFRAMATSFFTLPLALAFLVLAFLHAMRHFRSGAMRDAVAGGLYGLALAATHQYDVVTLYAVLGVYVLAAARHRVRGALVLVAIPLPFVLYSLAVVKLDPVFSVHTAAVMEVPRAAAHVLGWGLPLPLAVGALCVPAIRRRTQDVPFLGVWLGVELALLAVPLGFERKLIWGVHVPMCLLAALLVVHLLGRVARRAGPAVPGRAVVLGGSLALAAFCAIGSITLARELVERNRRGLLGDYLPDDFVSALAWLDAHSGPGEVVLASRTIAPLVPGRTGATVFAGHWAQTVDYAAKQAFVRDLFDPGQGALAGPIEAVLRRNRVRFIVLDASDLPRGTPSPAAPFGFAPYALQRYHNALVTIWEVETSHRPDGAVWGEGDWRGGP